MLPEQQHAAEGMICTRCLVQTSVVQVCLLIPTKRYQFELLDYGGPIFGVTKVERCKTADLSMRANGACTL